MHLAVISHKPCWRSPGSPSGYATDGGFPFQIEAISELFDRTTLLVPIASGPTPDGLNPLLGRRLQVEPLPALPPGRLRRMVLLPWLARVGPTLLRRCREADGVHAPVPGDIGMIGIGVALLLRKPLFVRYCGLWGTVLRFSHRLAFWLLQRIAGGTTVVLATGGGPQPPSAVNPNIRWIFATSLRQQEMASLPQRADWQAGEPLRLVTVARQGPRKRTDRIIEALSLVHPVYPQVSLQVVGDGSAIGALQRLTAELQLERAVHFRGKLDHGEVLETLCSCHVLCFPTESEGFPKAVHEAMACGLPVIASPVSVLPDLIGDSCGVLLRDRQATTIKQAILRLIESPDLLNQMARNARAAAASYSLESWRDTIGAHLGAAWGPLRRSGQS